MSDELLVLTSASDRNQSLGLEHTASRHKVPLVWLDGPNSNTSLDGFALAITAIEESEADYVMLTDAFDVLVSRWDSEEVTDILKDSIGGLLMSCEADCWPAGDWCRAYRAWEAPTPWYAICGGQYAGTRNAMISLMKEIPLRQHTITSGGSSQEIIHKLYSDGWPMGLDRHCRLFQSMSGHPSQYVIPKDGQAFNTVTRTRPMLMHWNGRTPGMAEWEKALCSA